jgi:hypothetical protein
VKRKLTVLSTHWVNHQLSLIRYIWNFCYSDQSPNHVETKNPDETLEESFFRAGNVEEYPQCGPNTRFPLHGLIEAAKTNRQHHNESCYVSIRECAKDEHELENENEDLKSLSPHFAFVIQGSQKFNFHTHEDMLKATAVELVKWLKSDERLNNGQANILCASPERMERNT